MVLTYFFYIYTFLKYLIYFCFTYFSIPKNEVKRNKWLSIVPIKGKIYDHAKICSLHFKPEDYDPDKGHLLKNCSVAKISAYFTKFICSISSNYWINYLLENELLLYEELIFKQIKNKYLLALPINICKYVCRRF